MKSPLFRITLALALIAGFAACKPIPPCVENPQAVSGKAKKEKKYCKRIRLLIQERDQLCSERRQLKSDTSVMGVNYRGLQNNYTKLKTEYNSLVEMSNSTIANMENLISEKNMNLKQLQSKLARQDSITNALNNIVKNALLGFNTDELRVEMKNGKVYVSMSDKLLFKSGSDQVEPKGVDAIKKLADVLNQNRNIDILVEGHTDSIPIKTAKFRDNWDLSTSRATNIVRMLVNDYGVDPRRLTSSGKAEFSPVASNSTPEGRARNRRTEIILSPKLDELFNIIEKK